MTGDGIIGHLYNADEVFMPWAISPYGKWSPTIQHFFFGTAFETQFHYDWPLTRPYAAKMHQRSIAHPCPAGIVHLADARWRATKSKQQYFYGHSWTCPTPREYAHQQLGLVISNALALHIRGAKMGTLIEATDDEIADGTELELGLDLNGGAAPIGLTADFLLPHSDRIRVPHPQREMTFDLTFDEAIRLCSHGSSSSSEQRSSSLSACTRAHALFGDTYVANTQ